MPRFAEEIGFVGGEQVDRHLHFGGILAALQQREIFRIPRHPGRVQALGQAPADQGFFAGDRVMPASSKMKRWKFP